MEAKLQALKVPELKALLTTANLSTTGVKADLIARLLENPQATASLGGESGESATKPATPAAPAAAPAPTPQKVTSGAENGKKPAAAAPAAGQPAKAGEPAAPEQSEEERRQVLIAELEKRKARAAKFGQPLGEAEAKLERLIKFGIDATEEAAVAKLSNPLGNKSRREAKPQQQQKKEAASIPSKPKESEEEKADRLAKLEIEKEKARKRAERFGIPVPESAAPAASKPEDEKKRKHEGTAATEKKVKT